MTARRWRCLLLVVVFALATASPGAARAAAAGKTTLVMQPPTMTATGDVALISAVLTGPDGRGVGDQQIAFYLRADLMGQSKASIGSATTDSAGIATVGFRLARAGAYGFGAAFAGSEELAPADAAPVSFDLTVAAPSAGAAPAPRELNVVGRWVPWSALIPVVAVWVTLVVVVASVIVAVPAAARRESERPSR